MQHLIPCDNCGDTMVTHCFEGNTDHYRSYFTPPIHPDLGYGSVGVRLLKICESFCTNLCRKCFTQ